MTTRSGFERWRDVLAYAVIGAVLLGFWTTTEELPRLAIVDRAPEMSLLLGIVALIAIHHWIDFRVEHFTYLLKYPPLVIAVLLATAMSAPVTSLRKFGGDAKLEVPTALIFYPIFLAVWGIVVRTWRPHRYDDSVSNMVASPTPDITGDFSAILSKGLQQWLKREEPIETKAQDWFRHSRHAKRIAQALQSETGLTAAVVGKFGSGKSSILKLLESELRGSIDPEVWLCPVTCWGFQDSAAAQEATLNQALAFLSKKIDCFAIRGLPAKYTNALSKTSSHAAAILSALSPLTDPQRQLKRLSPILEAAGTRLVIAIEDTDRNGVRFDVRDIEALLNRFRQVRGVSFVITAGPETPLDFARLCDHTEYIGDLKLKDVLSIVSKVRGNARQKYGTDVDPAHRDDRLLESERPVGLAVFMSGLHSWAGHVARLISTPRLLKSTLRRFQTAWDHIHGELDIDELLIICALRMSAPSAFSFMTRWIDFLRAEPPRSSSGATADENWTQRIKLAQEDWRQSTAVAAFDIIAASCLIQAILPRSQAVFGIKSYSKIEAVQSVRAKAPTDYWNRAFSENVMEFEVRDQDVLHAVEESNKDDIALDRLADNLIRSDPFAETFEYLAKSLRRDKLLPLNSKLYEKIRRHHGRYASNEVNGFIPLWRFTRTQAEQDKIGTWVATEIEAAFPGSLRFATDLFHYWSHEFPSNYVKIWREHVFKIAKVHFETGRAEQLINGLDENYPYTLTHLVFASNVDQELPLKSPSDWRWFSPILLTAVKQAPGTMIPQIAVMLNKAPTAPGTVIDFQFSKERIEALFADNAKDLLEELRKPVAINDKLDFLLRAQLKLLPQRATDWHEQ